MDFTQGIITTIDDLCMDKDKIRKRLEDLALERPPSIVIPMLYDELQGQALGNIVNQLNKCTYLNNAIIVLTAEDEEEYKNTVNYFNRLEIPHIVAWCESPDIQEIFIDLKDRGIDISRYTGKGMAIWIAIGIASLDSYAIIFHDADIETYTEEIPARLLLPILDPELGFFFSKGYYARISESRLYGRVCRLFLSPFLDALAMKTEYKSSFIRYLKAFRYPLSGEFAMTSDLALNIRIPADWGLELGVLAEVFKNSALERICQVDLGLYSHRHKEPQGLVNMVGDMMKTIFRTLIENDGVEISASTLISLRILYRSIAQDDIMKYFTLSKINDLKYDRHEELSMVELFAKILYEQGEGYLREPVSTQIPNWLRTISAMQGFRGKMLEVIPTEPKLQKRLMEAALADL
jgi:glucosyl-3-phosphoglycerate synthase